MNKQKGFSNVLGIILILIVLGGGAYWYSQNKLATPTPVPVDDTPMPVEDDPTPVDSTPVPTKVEQDEMSEWKTYRSEEHTISFKYPPTWYPVPPTEGSVFIITDSANIVKVRFIKEGQEGGGTQWQMKAGGAFHRNFYYRTGNDLSFYLVEASAVDGTSMKAVDQILSTFSPTSYCPNC